MYMLSSLLHVELYVKLRGSKRAAASALAGRSQHSEYNTVQTH